MGMYNLVPINGSVMIGNGKSISCTHKGELDVICKHKDGFIARETWDVKIVPQLNHFGESSIEEEEEEPKSDRNNTETQEARHRHQYDWGQRRDTGKTQK